MARPEVDPPTTGTASQHPFAWMRHGACRTAPVEIFYWPTLPGDIDLDEPDYPDPAALAYCSRCQVAATCLDWALDNGEVGVWGGTSTFQRRALKRRLHRTRCPTCTSEEIVQEGDHEICLACGVSWAY